MYLQCFKNVIANPLPLWLTSTTRTRQWTKCKFILSKDHATNISKKNIHSYNLFILILHWRSSLKYPFPCLCCLYAHKVINLSLHLMGASNRTAHENIYIQGREVEGKKKEIGLRTCLFQSVQAVTIERRTDCTNDPANIPIQRPFPLKWATKPSTAANGSPTR